MAELRYWVARSDVYRYFGDTGITVDNDFSLPALFYMLFLRFALCHIYHSTALIMSESAVLL